jgi:toxin secretion/phage lysis holin
MDKITGFKAAVSAILAALTAVWGWFGWCVIGWAFCMALDYITGTVVALKGGDWSSRCARDGLWGKFGCIAVVTVAGLFDALIGYLLSVTAITLPIEYTVLLCPLVIAWYTLTELGSIIENAGALGAPIPGFLSKAIKALQGAVEQSVERPE